MTELRKRLQAGDPLRREPTLTDDIVDRMRRTVVAVDRPRASRVSTTAVVLLAGLATVAGVGVWAVSAPASRPAIGRTRIAADSSRSADSQRRQLHFSTPGGTRVIWVFNSQFEDR